MALIKCSECGKEISDKAAACPHCGCPASAFEQSSKEEVTKKKQHRNTSNQKKKIIAIISITAAILILAILILTHTIGLNTENSDEQKSYQNGEIFGGVESEAETVVRIFSMRRNEVLTNFSTATEDGSDVLIPGTFAGLHGNYKVCINNNNDDVWRVIFERNEAKIDVTEVVDAISEYFGDYVEYDTEWNKYEWKTDKLELEFYVDEKAYFDLEYSANLDDEDSDDDTSSNTQENSNDNKKLTDSEIEDLAVMTLYQQLLAYENNYHNIDAASCRYSINKIERDNGSVEVYGIVYFYDKHGSITKFGYDYSSNFTVHMTEWGSTAWCEIE